MEQELIPDEQIPELSKTEAIQHLTSNNQVVRNEKGQIIKGTANPNGRPKGTISLTSKIKERLALIVDIEKKRQAIDLLADNMIQDALEGKNGMDKTIWSYLDGLPKQNMDLEIRVPKPLDDIQENNSLQKDQSPDQENPTDSGGDIGQQNNFDNTVSDSQSPE